MLRNLAFAAAAMLLIEAPAARAACTPDGPASITIVYTNAAGTVVGQKCYAVSDADMALIEAAYGSTLIGTPTVAQELLAMTNQWAAATQAFVLNYRQNQAAAAATAGINPPSIQ
jgi:hypothetical protein